MIELFSPTFWLVVVVVSAAIVMLIVLLWRKYDLDEITPLAPPFVKFKRKATPAIAPSPPSTAASPSDAAPWSNPKGRCEPLSSAGIHTENQSGGLNMPGGTTSVGGDMVAGNKIVHAPTPPSINIKGNRLIGNNKIGVKRGDVNIEDNDLTGKNEIDVDDPTARKKSDKGKRIQ